MPSAAYISLLTARITYESTENPANQSSVITNCKVDLCKAKIGCECIAFPSGKRVCFLQIFPATTYCLVLEELLGIDCSQSR